MIIRDMFADDINRKINGVIKVDQAADEVIEQELNEYVITKELKKHFITFFNYYSDALDEPTADIGVWISGFFGSGKSHFLKMLSYLLENKEVNGIRSVERFRKKFEDDPATYMMIDRSTKVETETILFNIDIEGSINKDKTAVLRVFAKTFYNHLGFFGDNLKVAKLEQYIDQQGKTEQFRRTFEEKKGMSWLESRKAFAFNGKYIIPTLMEVLDMSEEDARAWFNDKSAIEFSIAQLVEDIKDYLKTKPNNFRLLFMVDEVGQYVGTDTDMLLNLQSLVEKIGSECGGKVWVVCTGQEAIDEIIKVRADEFSRIQARFKTRLSLSSSSVDEVIQKRILKKNKGAEEELESVYNTTLFSAICSALPILSWTLRATPVPENLRQTSRLYRTSLSLCRKCLLRSGSTATPASIFPAVNVPCFPVSRKQHRKYRRRTSMPLYRSSVFTIPYILSWMVLSAVSLNAARELRTMGMALKHWMWMC